MFIIPWIASKLFEKNVTKSIDVVLTCEGDIDGRIISWGARLLTIVGKLNGQLHPRARSTRRSITPSDQNIWTFPVQKRERHCIMYIILS